MAKYLLSYDEEDVKAGRLDVDSEGVLRSAGGGVSSWNDLTDKPFEDKSVRTTVLDETYFEHGSSKLNITMINGKKYIFTVDGIEYYLEGDDGGDWGNKHISNSAMEDTGFPIHFYHGFFEVC